MSINTTQYHSRIEIELLEIAEYLKFNAKKMSELSAQVSDIVSVNNQSSTVVKEAFRRKIQDLINICLENGLLDVEFLKESLENAKAKIAKKNENPILKLSPEEVQRRRDEVRKMAAEEKPLSEILKYGGKKMHGAALLFLFKNYENYLTPHQERLFSVDLVNIDSRLTMALRNECWGKQMPV